MAGGPRRRGVQRERRCARRRDEPADHAPVDLPDLLDDQADHRRLCDDARRRRHHRTRRSGDRPAPRTVRAWTVLAVPGGPLDDTVPAARDITLRDLLSFRMGLGADFTGAPQPAMDRAASLGLPLGPPRPADYPDQDEYLRILGSVPLEHQPGARWLYHVGADVAGVLIARACGTTSALRCTSGCSVRSGWPTRGSSCRATTSAGSAPCTGRRTTNASASTRPTGNGAPRRRSRAAAPASCPPSTTSWRSPRCCATVDGTRTCGCCRRRRWWR